MKRLDTQIEKKYKSKTSFLQKAYLIVLLIFSVLLVTARLTGGITHLNPIWWILLFLIDCYFLYPIVFRYEYIFTKDSLIVIEGPLFYSDIPYDNITAYQRKGYFLNRKAKGSNTVLVKYKLPKKGHTLIEITPVNMADFMSDLKKRVHLK